MNGTHKQIFIVITQTGTMLSRILKRITGAEYNHASLSLSQDLTRMYSFGRMHPYNPFWGGFVIESPHAGTFRRFSDTTAIILAVEITEEREMIFIVAPTGEKNAIMQAIMAQAGPSTKAQAITLSLALEDVVGLFTTNPDQ